MRWRGGRLWPGQVMRSTESSVEVVSSLFVVSFLFFIHCFNVHSIMGPPVISLETLIQNITYIGQSLPA